MSERDKFYNFLMEIMEGSSSYKEIIDNLKLYCREYGFYYEEGAFRVVFMADFGTEVFKIPLVESNTMCYEEEENFKDAVEEGLDEFFARPTYLGKVHCNDLSVAVFSAPRVKVDEGLFEQAAMDYFCEEDYDDLYDWRDDEEILGGVFESYYGADRSSKLLNFLEERDIDDLHACNVGFIEKGEGVRPIIIDYPGSTISRL